MTTPAPAIAPHPSPAELAAYARDGYHLARGLVPRPEIEALRDHFMGLHARAPFGDYRPEPGAADPLRRFPRMMHPHRHDAVARRQLLDPRALAVLRALMGEEPLAAQSMFYFKPPGADGQGFHQDNFYLRAAPRTCLAAWLAVDDADAGNGALFVQPGTHRLPLLCPELGQVREWGELTPPPTPDQVVEVRMRAGDCLFFNGSLVHGSQRNASADRWRRSFICHYVGRGSAQVAAFYEPLLDAAGNAVPMRTVPDVGSPCGGPDGGAR